MSRFVVEETWNDEVKVIIDTKTNEEIAELTHDDLGWSGIDFIETLLERINKAL